MRPARLIRRGRIAPADEGRGLGASGSRAARRRSRRPAVDAEGAYQQALEAHRDRSGWPSPRAQLPAGPCPRRWPRWRSFPSRRRRRELVPAVAVHLAGRPRMACGPTKFLGIVCSAGPYRGDTVQDRPTRGGPRRARVRLDLVGDRPGASRLAGAADLRRLATGPALELRRRRAGVIGRSSTRWAGARVTNVPAPRR
jgi:hypothetical protein